MKRRLSALIPFISVLAVAGCSNSISDTGGAAGTGAATGGSAGASAGAGALGGSTSATGGAGVGGSPTTGVGGDSTAGAATGGGSTGGSSTGGSSAGGTSAGGTSAGGTSAGGTSAGGTGGTVGAAGGGTSGAAGTLTISSATDGAFNNAFMITACGSSGSGFDCPNSPPGGQCSTAKWSYKTATGTVSTGEATGISNDEVFTVTGGDPSKIYDVTVHVEGQAEGRTYTGGVASSTTVDPGVEKNDMLYTGGQPGPMRPDYNVFHMTITGGTPIPGAATYYAFNATLQKFEGAHHNYSLDETFTFKVKSGMTLTLTNHDSNCISIKNCGSSAAPYEYANAADCESHARATPADVTLPATFHGITIMSPQKFQTQFLNFKVTSIVAE